MNFQIKKTYIPLAEKLAFAEYCGSRCFDRMEIHASDGGENVPMPPMYKENAGLKMRYLMGALVKMYLRGELGQADEVNAYAASLFYTVDRYATFKKAYEADWKQGSSIIADRYTTSNMFHQCTKEPKENWDSYLNWLEDLEYEKVGLPRPTQVIYLDVEPEVSRALLSKRYEGDESKKDIHEANFAYLLRCREAALYAAEKFGWKVIACNKGSEMRSIEEISDEIWGAVHVYFE